MKKLNDIRNINVKKLVDSVLNYEIDFNSITDKDYNNYLLLECFENYQEMKELEGLTTVNNIKKLFAKTFQLFGTYNNIEDFNNYDKWYKGNIRLNENDDVKMKDIDWKQFMSSDDLLNLHQYDYFCANFDIGKSIKFYASRIIDNCGFYPFDNIERMLSDVGKEMTIKNIEDKIKNIDEEKFEEFYSEFKNIPFSETMYDVFFDSQTQSKEKTTEVER